MLPSLDYQYPAPFRTFHSFALSSNVWAMGLLHFFEFGLSNERLDDGHHSVSALRARSGPVQRAFTTLQHNAANANGSIFPTAIPDVARQGRVIKSII